MVKFIHVIKTNIHSGIHGRHPYNKAGDGPEGVELRITTEWLHHNFSNCIIKRIIYNEKSSLYRNGTSQKGDKQLINYFPLQIEGVTCKGKHIIWICKTLNNGETIYFHNHLAMTGRWCLTKGNNSNLELVILKGETEQSLFFDDIRRFGDFSVQYSLDELTEKIKEVGIDLMDVSIKYYCYKDKQLLIDTQKSWLNHFNKLNSNNRSRKREIYPILMEQKYFAGLGNYLSCELLFECKISPQRKIMDLNSQEIVNIFNKAIELLYCSYRYGGLTIKDFWDPEGKIGKFPRKVYGHDKDPNGYDVIKTKFSNGRTCQWVREVQL